MKIRTPRLATADDIPRLVEIINRAYIREAAIVHGQRTDRVNLRDRLSAPNTWFLALELERDDAAPIIVGCVCLDCDGQRGHIGLLSVDPEFQGQGLGAKLLHSAESLCEETMGCAAIELDVVSVRAELFPFYDHMGYVRTGTKPFPDESRLKQPAHMVVMQKRLSNH